MKIWSLMKKWVIKTIETKIWGFDQFYYVFGGFKILWEGCWTKRLEDINWMVHWINNFRINAVTQMGLFSQKIPKTFQNEHFQRIDCSYWIFRWFYINQSKNLTFRLHPARKIIFSLKCQFGYLSNSSWLGRLWSAQKVPHSNVQIICVRILTQLRRLYAFGSADALLSREKSS